jgi:hypothetical protein
MDDGFAGRSRGPFYLFRCLLPYIDAAGCSSNRRQVDAGLYINLLIGASLALLSLLTTYRIFIGIYRYNLKSAAIARFNAEAL